MHKFGFISHTIEMNDLKAYAPSLLNKSPIQCKKMLRSLPAKIITRMKNLVSLQGHMVEGIIATTWLLPEQYLELSNGAVLKKIIDAARLLEKEGATIIGLGGYNSIVPAGSGRIVARNCRVGLTNGNSYTIQTAMDGVENALAYLSKDKSSMNVVVVGATGSIGSVITEIVATQPYNKILICGRNPVRLEGKAKKIEKQFNRRIQSHIPHPFS